MELLTYEKSYEKKIKDYHLSAEQLRFTGTPKECVAQSETDANRHCILALENHELVTFFVLHEKEGVKPYAENPHAMLLRAFSTDLHHQGKGYAKQALLQLPAFIKEQFPHIDQVVLAVNVKNTAAQSLYKKCGYVDEGVRKMGRKGELVIMNYYFN